MELFYRSISVSKKAMRCFFILILTIAFSYSSFAQANPFLVKKTAEHIYTKTEVEAGYRGGMGAWLRFLQKNLQYPESSITSETTGSMGVQFIVYKSGKIGDVIVTSGGSDTALANEVIRVIKLSDGKWDAAVDKGKKVNSYKHLPLTICLRGNDD